jgi:hypothetical protein
MATQAAVTDVNLFVVLDLDPARPWSVANVERELKDRQAKWSKLSAQVGPRADDAKRRREQLKELNLTDILSSQDKLDKHRVLAAQEMQTRQEQQVAALEEEIRFARAKGYLIQPEVDDLIERYTPTLTKERVGDILARESVRQPADITSLSPVILGQIDRLLDSLQQGSLYTFLNSTETTPRTSLLNEADRLAEDARKHPPNQAKFDYQKDLAGHARHIFESDEKRAQYDQHLREVRLIADVLKPYLQLCNLTKEISLAQVELLLKRAALAGWKDDEAQQMLFSLAIARGWRVEVPASSRSSTVAAENKVITELKQALSRERQQREQAERQKQDADKKLADTEAERRHILDRTARAEKERDARQKAELEKLQAKLDAAEAEAKRLDTTQRNRSKREQEQLAQAKSEADRWRRELTQVQKRNDADLQQRISEVGPTLQQHLAHAELIQAQALIKSFPEVPPQWAEEARRIEDGIARAEERLREAQRTTAFPARREELVAQALAACADFVRALEYQQSLQPLPPTALQATPDTRGVSLAWQASASPRVGYVVVRKDGEVPISVHDGDRLATVTACGWHDPVPPLGRSFFYAVFAERGTLMSTQAATLAQPIVLTPDVSDLHAEVSDAAVTLTWSAPTGCSAVIVVRRDGAPPQSIHDGIRQTIRNASRYTDSGLQNGRTHFYRLYAEYLDRTGQARCSSGVVTSATPETPPQTVPALTLRETDGIMSHTVNLSAEPPERGELCIYRSGEAPAVTSGERVPDTALGRVFGAGGHRLTSMSDSLFAAGLVYYTPVLLFQGTAYIGEPLRYSYLPGVGQLRTVQVESGIRVTWQWRYRCEEAEVSWAPAGQAWRPAASATVVKAGTERTGSYDLPPLGHGNYSIQVRARYHFDGQVAVSEAQFTTARGDRRVAVRYTVRTVLRVLGSRQFVVELEADELVALPALHVVAKERYVPEGPDDGAVCGSLPAQSSPGRKWTIPIAGYPVGSAAQIAIFPEPGGRDADVVFVAQHPDSHSTTER